ncbi:hybrid sensor histidine kinase/response regulator [Stutzerimonas chloritidismutans]|uniref:hybrid sensor histidine kinase/response regulator n=1 Tax=Stutzerimonas chloritidismutans TaxID=203192 RepID=UPI003F14603E
MNQARRATLARSVSLRSRLIAIAVAGILPLALVAGLGMLSIVNEQKRLAEKRSLETTRLAATAVEVELSRSLNVLQALSQSPLLDEGNLDSFADMVRRVLPSLPSWHAMLIIDPDGRVLRRVSLHAPSTSQDLAEPGSFTSLLASHEPQVGSMGRGPSGTWGIPLRVLVDVEGETRYILTAVLKPQSIADVINNRRLPTGWVNTVLDANGVRIARSLRHEETLGGPASPLLQKLLRDNPNEEGMGLSASVEGEGLYTSFVRLKPSGWVVATGIPTSVVEAGAMRAYTLYGGGLLLSLMFAVAAALFATRRINVPMRQLRRAAQAIGSGRAVEAPASEIEEIQEVGQALANAAAARQASEAERDSMLSRLELAQQDLTQQVSDLEHLQALSNRLLQMPALEEQLQAIIDTLCTLHGAAHGLLALSDGTTPLRIHASRGFSIESLALMDNVSPGLGACGAAVQSGTRVVVIDTETDPCFRDFVSVSRREGFRSVHSTPIRHSDHRVLGTLTVQLRDARPPTQREIRLADVAAGLAAVFIDRARAQSKAGMFEQRLQVALDSSTVPFAILSPLVQGHQAPDDFRLDFINPTGAASLHGSVAELTGQHLRDVLGPGANPQALSTLLDVYRLQQPRDLEMRSTAFGGERWVRLVATPFDESVAVWFADVTEAKQQEQAIREAGRRKDEFLATLAHELRNPLAPIRLAAGLFGSPSATEAQKLRSQQIIERQVRHMALLLDDLFDISRITLGKLVLRKDWLDLRSVVEAAVETARAKIEAKRHALTVMLPPAPVMLEADALRLEQILTNLLNNAAKFTPDGGSISVTVTLAAGRVRVTVADNGLGVAREHLGLIFERFAQVPVSEGQVNTGLGIGLALAQGLAKLHEADIQVTSEGLGKGAAFSLELPLPPVTSFAGLEQAVAVPTHVSRCVLVADDNRDIAETMAEVLRLEGHEVHLAHDGVQALERYRELKPDVVLLDIGMPGLRGDEVARAIREQDAEVRLLAITGWGQPSDKERALSAGFDEHMTKPVDIALLIEAVGR